jgi:hypothetical protein
MGYLQTTVPIFSEFEFLHFAEQTFWTLLGICSDLAFLSLKIQKSRSKCRKNANTLTQIQKKNQIISNFMKFSKNVAQKEINVASIELRNPFLV